MRSTTTVDHVVVTLLLASTSRAFASTSLASDDDGSGESSRHRHHRRHKNPKMIVFGDSTSDSGRRFHAPGSFHFGDIGPFPFEAMFETSDPSSEMMFEAYTPSVGSVTNGKAWPDWLHVPQVRLHEGDLLCVRYSDASMMRNSFVNGDRLDYATVALMKQVAKEYNFATSSASASDTFRSVENCIGYTGVGEDFPTGTLSEQISRYFNDVVEKTDETLDYTHVIILGSNDFTRAVEAFARYYFGPAEYEDDFVPRDLVFDGDYPIFLSSVIAAAVGAVLDGVSRLLDKGVTGKILVGNIPSAIGLPDAVTGDFADQFEAYSSIVRAELSAGLDAIASDAQLLPDVQERLSAQLKVLDLYTLFAAIVNKPEAFTDEGFSAETLGSPCLVWDFLVDTTAEIMGTQDGRSDGCKEECALCADFSSPCQTCFEGSPSASLCEDDPDTRLFWDANHPTTAFHKFFGRAVRQCGEDEPDESHAWVSLLCPALQ